MFYTNERSPASRLELLTLSAKRLDAVVPVCRIAMSYGLAKTLLPTIAKLITMYELEFGAIPAPGFDDLAKE